MKQITQIFLESESPTLRLDIELFSLFVISGSFTKVFLEGKNNLQKTETKIITRIKNGTKN